MFSDTEPAFFCATETKWSVLDMMCSPTSEAPPSIRPCTSNDKVLYQPINLIARQSDFREKRLLRKGNASRSSHLHCRIPLRYRTFSTSRLENINHTPFQDTRQSLRVRNTPVFQDRLIHVQLLFT